MSFENKPNNIKVPKSLPKKGTTKTIPNFLVFLISPIFPSLAGRRILKTHNYLSLKFFKILSYTHINILGTSSSSERLI